MGNTIGMKIHDRDYEWHDCLQAPFTVHGLATAEKGRFYRLPDELLDAFTPTLSVWSRVPAGGRIRFRTDSPRVIMKYAVIRASLSNAINSGVAGSCADGYVDGRFRGNRPDWVIDTTRIEKALEKDGTLQDIDIYLPAFNELEEFSVGLVPGSALLPPRPYTVSEPIVFYGSSITHGAAASHPGNSYVARTARALDADFVNLGFAGSAHGEPRMAQYIAGLSMSAFVLDFDYNGSDDELARNHLPFYETVREAQPDLPILIVSMPVPHGSGSPGEYEWALRRRDIIRRTYETALSRGDRRVAFLDGSTFFPEEDWDACTADTLHPNDLGFHYMARAVTPVLKELMGRK